MEITTEEPEEFHRYCQKEDFQDNESSFYHIAASCYRLVGLTISHPTREEVIEEVMEVCKTVEATALSAMTEGVIDLRVARDSQLQCPIFLQMAEEWVRITVRDGDQEMPEAYRALGMLYKLSTREMEERWRVSGEQDMMNWKLGLQSLGLPSVEYMRLDTHLDEVFTKHQFNRRYFSASQTQSVLAMLDGVAEDEARIPLTTSDTYEELMDQYITNHGLACVKAARSWAQVARGKTSKQRTITQGAVGTADAYEALPALSSPPTAMTRTLQEHMTVEEREKAETCLIRQRGREHAINPPIEETQWPEGEKVEIITSRSEKIKQLTRYDSTVFLSRVVQIMGIKKPMITQQDLEANPPLTLKAKIRRELQTCITKAGHHDEGPTTSTTYADNQWRLDEEWFDHNWSTLFKSGDGAFQSETIYMVLKTRMYFGTVGTYGTKHIGKRGQLVPYGNQGSGRVIFGMCQMVTSDYCYTESTKREVTKKYYWQYWMVGMDTSCKIENLFHAKTGPLLAVFRGIHAEVDQQTALAVQMLAIRQHAIDAGLAPDEFGLTLEQDWHAGKVHADGRHEPMTKDDPDYYAKSQNNDKLFQSRKYRVERATEMVVCLKYVGGVKGQDVTSNTVFKAHKTRILTEFHSNGSYVNLGGLRMERFPSHVEMQKQRKHALDADVPHTIVIENVTPHILARDIVEELLADPTQTNWKTLPNATMVFYQPPSAYAWARKGARIVIVFRHEIPPAPLDESKPHSEAQRLESENAQATYLQRTDHTLEIGGIIAKYSAPTMGGASSTLTEVDCRSKYIELGRRYALVKDPWPTGSSASPSTSPMRKKQKKQNTPEHNKIVLRTPSTGSTASSMISSVSATETGVKKYNSSIGEIGDLVDTISRLSAEVTSLRVTQEAQAKANDNRHTATENKLRTVETTVAKVEKSITSGILKAMIRDIRDEANKLQAMKREHEIYVRQLAEANREGSKDRRIELQGKLEVADNQIQSLIQSLSGLREDAKEQAELDGTVLTDTQLRNDE
jgi:hypothetical protein